ALIGLAGYNRALVQQFLPGSDLQIGVCTTTEVALDAVLLENGSDVSLEIYLGARLRGRQSRKKKRGGNQQAGNTVHRNLGQLRDKGAGCTPTGSAQEVEWLNELCDAWLRAWGYRQASVPIQVIRVK